MTKKWTFLDHLPHLPRLVNVVCELPLERDSQFEIGLQVLWQNHSPSIGLTILWFKDIWRGRQKECGVKRWVKKLPWKFFDSWNMGLRFPIWDWVAGAMTKCIVPAWLYCAPHVSGSYGSYIVYAFSAVTLFDNKFTLPASCKLKVGTMAQCGLKIKVRKSRKQFMVSSIFPNKNEQFFYPILSRFYRNCLEISG